MKFSKTEKLFFLMLIIMKIYLLKTSINYMFNFENIKESSPNIIRFNLVKSSSKKFDQINVSKLNLKEEILNKRTRSIDSKVLNKSFDTNDLQFTKKQTIFSKKELTEIKAYLQTYDLNTLNNETFECFKTAEVIVQTTVCIHNISNDIYVSNELKEYGIWELNILTLFMKMLDSTSNLQVFDIGANLGQYCLFAAKFGRKCVAVEPFYDNVIRLHKSAQIENISNNIILVTNGISDRRGKLHHLSKNDHNVGGQGLIYNIDNTQLINLENSSYNKYNVITIEFDDLISVLPEDFTEEIMKIDIEDSEFNAFKNAGKLFERVKVYAVFFEWSRKNKMPYNEILSFFEFMNSRNFEAMDLELSQLRTEKWSSWPDQIVWIQRDFNFNLDLNK